MQSEDPTKLSDPLTADQKVRLAAAVQEQRARLEQEVRVWARTMKRTFKGILTASERRRNLERTARVVQAAQND